MTCTSRETAWAAWYGLDPIETIPFQALARRRFGDRLTIRCTAYLLEYGLHGLTGPGLPEPVTVRIRFYRRPPYPTFGLDPRNLPQVHSVEGQRSPHRWPDNALCLYAPFDPPDQRWVWNDGLAMLIDLVQQHLTLEHLWRRPNRPGRHRWLGEEAPHGVPR